MAWYLGRGERIICDGACSASKIPGFLPCPIDHAAQPFNDVDTDNGTPFYRCNTCDWVRPDPAGENKYETAGMITCPDCEAGERNDTYAGPCEEGCNKRGVGAEDRPIPADIVSATRRKHGRTFRTSTWACAKCFHKMCKRERRQLAAEIRADEEYAAWEALNAMFPPGTCGICRKIHNLQVIDNEAGDYVCVDCYPTWVADRVAQVDPEPAAQIPAEGWYPDPDDPEQYLRWWSGIEWVGLPTLPQHILNQ